MYKCPSIRIAFMGDINPGGVLTFTGGVSQSIIEHLSTYDVRIATLESALGEHIAFDNIKMADPKKAYIIFSPDSSVGLLKDLTLDAVSLANNHATDCGLEGLYHTIDVLDENKIGHFGAGHNLQEAQNAFVIDIKGQKIAFIGYCTPWSYMHEPTETEGGTNLICSEKMINDVKHYKMFCDYVFVMPHWGKEKTIRPMKEHVILAKTLIKAGATGVIGSHTHTVQPFLRYKNKIIAMSLGNFVFPDRYIKAPKVTCYPSADEREQLDIPVTEKYPLVERLTYKRIPNSLRYGAIMEIIVKGRKVKCKCHYTYMSNHNTVSFKSIPYKFKVKMILYRMWMRIA